MKPLFFVFAIGLGISSPSKSTHPELIEVNITALNYIEEISRFRSGAGHEFYYDATFPFGATDSSEPPSSMKHYLSPYDQYKDTNGRNDLIPIYAPFNGSIVRVTNENCCGYINKRVEIQSLDNSAYTLIIFHINLDNAYPQIYNDWPAHLWPAHLPDDSEYETLTVNAGDLLGYADLRDVNDFDVAVLWDNGIDRYWISYFDLLSTAVEDEYLRRGISIDELTISQSTRLAEPVTWWGGRNDDDWVLLLTPYQIPAIGSIGLIILWLSVLRLAMLTLIKKRDLGNHSCN
ncbi:MAG: hypothetical protein VX231_07090 [Pseudomonadota bacterium]|nr:hypothetical protein [Pseudomonadota bacterium]